MYGSFEVVDYTIENLKKLLQTKTKASSLTIDDKQHCNYFAGYFEEIGAKQIIAELRYVDHDFLEDFAGYYVKCFRNHERKCTRLHFFRNSFSPDDFAALLCGREGPLSQEILNENYLGFIVVKPLPVTIIGRTCLRTYPTDNTSHIRHYPITRSYEVNLFGLCLTVETLAFQEQDSVTSACATSALWSVFQGTGKLFQHAILSPVEITKAATEYLPIESRVIPNKGLNAGQMAQAIRGLKLEPLSLNVDDIRILKGTVHAYLCGRIPLILVVDLYDQSSNKKDKLMGRHGVAVAGYGLKKGALQLFNEKGFLLKAMSVDRLYAHDDQVGPYARMHIDGIKIKDDPESDEIFESLSTSWMGYDRKFGSVRAIPRYLLLPLYHKIRIPYITILNKVSVFDSFLETLRSYDVLPMISQKLEWDVFLSTSNEYKGKFYSNGLELESEARGKVLTKRMSKFIWVGKATIAGEPFLDLIFDATEIEQGNLFLIAVEYDKSFACEIRKIAKLTDVDEINKMLNFCDIMKWYYRQPEFKEETC